MPNLESERSFGASIGSLLNNLSYGTDSQNYRDIWRSMTGTAQTLATNQESSIAAIGNFTQNLTGSQFGPKSQSSFVDSVTSALTGGTSEAYSDKKALGGMIGTMMAAGVESAAREVEEQRKREEQARQLARNGGPIGQEEAKRLAGGNPGVADAIEQEKRLNLASNEADRTAKVALSGYASSYMGIIEQVRDGAGKFADLDSEQKLQKISGYRSVALDKLALDPSFTSEHKDEFCKRADMCARQVRHQA